MFRWIKKVFKKGDSSTPSQRPPAEVTRVLGPCFISKLPPELLFLILQFSADSLGHDNSPSPRLAFLSGASTVAQSWKVSAQALLWANIFVETEERAQKLLLSPLLGTYLTRSVCLSGDPALNGVSAATARKILMGMKEVTSLGSKHFPGRSLGRDF